MMNSRFAALAALFLLPGAHALAQGSGPVFYPANGHHYEVVPGNFTWDQAKTDAEAMTYLGVAGHLVTYDDLAEDQFVYFTLNGSSLGNAWIGLYQDLNDVNYSEPGGGWRWVTGEPLTYSNWGNNEPNNGGNTEHYGGYWPADKWNDYTVASGGVGRYVVEYDTLTATAFCFGDGSGTVCPCGNIANSETGCFNSTGVGSMLQTTGTASLGSNDLVFAASNLLPGQTAILFEGTASLANGNGILFGDGLRCAGGPLRRLGYQTPDFTGIAAWAPGATGNTGWTAGSTRYFQVWYSDPLGSPCSVGFNTSNALEVSFVP